MSRIKSVDTAPEIVVRSALHRLGYRFALHRRNLPGRPDIVLPKYNCVVLVHGCFWHRHARCRYAYTPKSRLAFWHKKFQENVDRDLRAKRQLQGLGWTVFVVWECQIHDINALTSRLRGWLMKQRLGSGQTLLATTGRGHRGSSRTSPK